MAVNFNPRARNNMLESLKTFRGGVIPQGTAITGMKIIASSSPTELVRLADQVVTYGTAVSGSMSIVGAPVITIPAGSTVASLFLVNYNGNNNAPIGYRVVSPAQVFETAGTITITGSTISIVNPT